MNGGKHLLLLAVSVFLARCQQTPTVSMSPPLKQIFSGDLFYLSCDNIVSGSTVKWYFNNIEQKLTKETWKIAAASPKHSGSYRCESNGQKSVDFPINVLAYIPRALLTIETGQPVMRTGGSVVLQLDKDNGLTGWNCWVCRGKQTSKIKLRLPNGTQTLTFQPRALNVPETIFWCTDNAQQMRSNQIIVRTSEKDVSLEMYPLPAVAGESLTLRCLVWGTNMISRTIFYKDNAVILEGASPTHKVPNVTESDKGSYKCSATFTHEARTSGDPYKMVSDDQDMFVQVPPVRAVLSGNTLLSCSCQLCPSEALSFHWYYKNDDGQAWTFTDSNQEHKKPQKSGSYACKAMWKTGMSSLSNSYVFSVSDTPSIKAIVVCAVVGVSLVVLCLAAFCIHRWRRRSSTEPLYEDVALTSRNKGDDKYETLQKPSGGQREGEYDTIQPEASGGAAGYEALKKEGMKEGVYHTLGMEGAAGGAGGYETLKKEGMKEGVYHTLGVEAGGGQS